MRHPPRRTHTATSHAMTDSPPAPLDDGIWVVVPAYNEAARIERTVTGLLHAGVRNVVVVDDGSRDETAAVALRSSVWVLRHIVNRGQGAALQTGINFALERGARVIVTFDGDGQHDPNEIRTLLAPVLAGTADVALGSRFLGSTVGIPFSRKLVLKLATAFTRVVSRIRVTDTHNGFRALSRRAAELIQITQDRMAHASEFLDEIRRHELRHTEVPVTVSYTVDSLAKGQNSWAAVRIVWQLFVGKVIR
jgi:glycosyltransferase involved in cell wall biosynthesis